MTTITPISIEAILRQVLPTQTYIEVRAYKGLSFDYIKIMFAASDYLINNVQGQRPQVVSLSLCTTDLELKPQSYGGNGGNGIYREPNLQDRSEMYLAMKNVRVPFRTPQRNEIAVNKAIKKFAENWLKAIQENKEVLCYRDKVDYSIF